MSELHLHLDGAVRPETAWELYKRQNREIPAADLATFRAMMLYSEKMVSLDDLITSYDVPLAIMQEPDAIERITYESILDLAKQGTTYAELRFSPAAMSRGRLTQQEVIDCVISGVGRARAQHPEMVIGLILCLVRGYSAKDNDQTMDLLLQYRNTIICGLDLIGDEEEYPLYLFSKYFKLAQEMKIPFTIHAGETDSEIDMQLALDLKPKRISHALYAYKYPRIMEQIKTNDITLEICLTSNFITNKINYLIDHPLKKYLEAGIKVCLCSDDPTIFATNQLHETKLARDSLGITYEQCMQMEKWAEEARFYKGK